jgi:hypothetical protein
MTSIYKIYNNKIQIEVHNLNGSSNSKEWKRNPMAITKLKSSFVIKMVMLFASLYNIFQRCVSYANSKILFKHRIS